MNPYGSRLSLPSPVVVRYVTYYKENEEGHNDVITSEPSREDISIASMKPYDLITISVNGFSFVTWFKSVKKIRFKQRLAQLNNLTITGRINESAEARCMYSV